MQGRLITIIRISSQGFQHLPNDYLNVQYSNDPPTPALMASVRYTPEFDFRHDYRRLWVDGSGNLRILGLVNAAEFYRIIGFVKKEIFAVVLLVKKYG